MVPNGKSAVTQQHTRRLVVLLYPEYEILDVFGPLEFFAYVSKTGPEQGITSEFGYQITVVADSKRGAVKESGGPGIAYANLTVDEYLDQHRDSEFAADLLLIPGGQGARTLVNDERFLERLRRICDKSKVVASVCTGSALLAKAGLLDGRRATSNKRSFGWATSQSSKVAWVAKARWVVDGKFVTSSGIAAGMDMALEIIARDFGRELAREISRRAEYVWNEDMDNDLFEAKL